MPKMKPIVPVVLTPDLISALCERWIQSVVLNNDQDREQGFADVSYDDIAVNLQEVDSLLGLSLISCLRHNIFPRSIYATQTQDPMSAGLLAWTTRSSPCTPEAWRYARYMAFCRISSVTVEVMTEVTVWQARPLEPMYSVVFQDRFVRLYL